MQITKMMVLVEAGAVREVEAILHTAGGWVVWIVYRSRDIERREPLERQRKGPRIFATLDAAARALAGVGVSAFRVNTAGLAGGGDEPP
jgi:hypothetical protein